MKRKTKRKGVSYGKYGYLFLAPFILCYLIFSIYPLIYSIQISFTDLKGFGTQMNFVGLENYVKVLTSKSYWDSIINTVVIWVVNFIPQLFFGLFLAVLFTSSTIKVRGQGFFKVFMYLPNIITAASVALLFSQLFGYPEGPVNTLLVKLGFEKFEFMRDAAATRGVISYIYFWMWYGYTMLLFIAGILGISPVIFEAARIDGASNIQTFFHITLPSLRTMTLYILVTCMVGGFQNFDIVKMYNDGAPNNTSRTVMMYIYDQAFTGDFKYCTGAAASVILFLIIAALSAVLFVLMRDRDDQKKGVRGR